MSEKNKYFELFRNTGMLAIGYFSSKILVFLLVPLYTYVLSTREVGIYDVFITTIQLLIPVFSLNVTDGVLRFVLESKENENKVFGLASKYLLLSIIPAALIIIVNQVAGFSPDLKTYGIFVLLYYIFHMFNMFFIQFAKGIDRVSAMTKSGVLGTIVTILFCILGLLVFHSGLVGFFVANILGQLIPALYLFFSLRLWRYIPNPKTSVDNTFEKRFLRYSIPLIMTTIGWWLNNTSDKYVITAIKGVELNGLLSIAYKIPSILTILYSVFIQAWQITAMKEYGKKESGSFYNQVFCALNMFIYCAASVLIIGNRLIAHFAFSKDFYAAWVFVPYLLMSAAFTASASYIAPILTSSYNTWDVAKSTIIGGLLNVVLNIVLLYMIGDIGVAAATMISSFIIMFIRYRATKGVITKESFRKGCILWGLLCVQATLDIFKLEALQIPCIAAALILNRREISELIKKTLKIIGGKRHENEENQF